MNKMEAKSFNSLVDLYKSNNLEEAEKKAQELIQKHPNESILHNLLGAIFTQKKNLEEAALSFKKAVSLNANYFEAYNNLGNVLREQKKFKEAKDYFNTSLSINSDYPETHNNLGILYKEQENFQKASYHYKKSIELNPGLADPYNNIGNLYKDTGQFHEAINNFNKAISIMPNFGEAYNNLALTLQKQNKFEEAERAFKRALKIIPDNEECKYNLAYLYLTLQNFKDGWLWHEYRKAKNVLTKKFKLQKNKMWDGEKFNGRLLIISEQGLGDQILFSSILKDLLENHKNVTMTIEFRLLSIFQRSFKGINFIPDTKKINFDDFEKYIFLGSLGKIYRKSINEFPKKQKSFLTISKKKSDWVSGFVKKSKNKKIGLSWKTSSVNNRKGRSIPINLFEPVLKTKNIDFLNLQYGNSDVERAGVMRNFNIEIFHIESLDYKNDIEGLASLVATCDLVITIPNFTTSLAASLGIPVFVLLPFSSDWRWFLNSQTSPWYPTVKIFRQKKLGEWQDVINEVRDSL